MITNNSHPEPATGNQLAAHVHPSASGDFLTSSEASALLRISRSTLRNRLKAGSLPHIRRPGERRVLFHKPTLEAFLLRSMKGND